MNQLIVLDTNCLVQIISAHSPFRSVWRAFLQKRYALCVTNEILNEYQEVLERYTTPEIAENVILLLLNSRNVKFFSPHFHFNLITQDPDDNKFVDCAIIAGAEYIVSEDAHFRVLRDISFPMVRVIRLEEFKQALDSSEANK